jgi:hypothetical protein
MQLKTLALAAAFAVTSSFAFAQAGGSNTSSPEKPAGTMQKGTTVDRPSESTSGMSRSNEPSGPRMEPGGADASRPGGKGVSDKPGN